MFTLSKVCVRCKTDKPFSEFYIRSGYNTPDNPPTEPGHYNSECKFCIQDRSKQSKHLPATEPRAKTEIIAINRLHQEGIHALPGKAVLASDVDVVAWGCVWIEVKYSRLGRRHGVVPGFIFNATPAQMRRGFLAHIVMLICEHPDGHCTFHLFDAKDPVFYIHGRVKSGMTFRPKQLEAIKHGNNRVVMTQPMMDAAHNAWHHIENVRQRISEELRKQ